MAAFVYLIEEKSYPGETTGPWTKIGYSKNPPEWRLEANLKRGNPRDLRVAVAFQYRTERQAQAAEKAAHEAFAKHAHQKEWFHVRWKTVARWFERHGAKARKKDA